MKWLVAIIIGATLFAACGSNTPTKSTTTTIGTTATTASTTATTATVAKPAESAGDAVKRLLGFVDKRQFGPEWDELHPLQQATVNRDLYMKCAVAADFPNVSNIKVTDTYTEDIAIPGTTTKAPSTAVSVTYTLSHGTDQRIDKATFHEIAVDGHWRWILSDPTPYVSGKCPS